NLSKFEESIGVHFNHIRLLARAFTDRSIGFNNLTLGSNQRLEFLGDTVLQLVASEYLYKYFPEHHEGHLSLLRSSLVNNRTQAVVCDDLGMTAYAMYSHLKTELKTKDRADLLEAFLGALYIDRGLDYCRAFCQVCFLPTVASIHHEPGLERSQEQIAAVLLDPEDYGWRGT
ncbi:ribonuclease 3-like, partial [Penaeus monodon]|uniref:ribonuclease 3-like n=1 Tax=Penaeus monodon TaxID=6687 RepID=UPI0018A6EF76